MISFTDTQPDTEQLLDEVLALSTRLHESIAHFDEPNASYEIAGAPGVAFFERGAGATITHASSSPSPALLPVLEDLRPRHLAAAGVEPGIDNSHLPSLLLLCLMLVDREAAARFKLDQLVHKPAEVAALDEESGQHDPNLEPHDAALRAWVPMVARHAPQFGVHPAILELRFRMQRSERYAPW